MSTFTLSPARPSALQRCTAALGRHPALTAAAAVLTLAWPGLIAVHHAATLPLPRSEALAHVRADAAASRQLSRIRWTSFTVAPVDRTTEVVAFSNGPRVELTVQLDASGRVQGTVDLTQYSYIYGSNIAHDPRVLALLCAVFVLMTAVWPLRRLRNLDVLVTLSTVSTIVLLDRSMPGRMVLPSSLALAYLAARCAFRALGRHRESPPATPLYDHLTAHWDGVARRRILRLTAVAAGLVLAMVGLSSAGVMDVGQAVLEGATAIIHGLSPYGHIPVAHGDTYPFGSYLLYIPFAWLSPVNSAWDSLDAALLAAVIAALLTASGLARAARRSRPTVISAGTPAPPPVDLAGLRAATAWLTFPPVLVAVSAGTTDVALGAILLMAVVLWRRPAASTAILGLAAWFKLSPVALLPIWLARLRGRSLLTATLALAAVSVTMLAVLVALGGPAGVTRMFHALSFQVTRTSPDVLWSLTGSVPFQQLAQALTLALVAGGAVRIARDPDLSRDRARIAALCAAVMIGVQFSANYWSYMYLAWILPFLSLSLLAAPGAQL